MWLERHQQIALDINIAKMFYVSMLTPKQAQLASLMSFISERCWCAGWISGNEFRLWKAVIEPNDDFCYGFSNIESHQVEEMRKLSREIGGWFTWQDSSNIQESRESFISMNDWLQVYSTFSDQDMFELCQLPE
jgi:hypothetical protein